MHRRPLSSLFPLMSLPVSVLLIAPLLLASVMAQGQTYIFGRNDIPVGAMPNAVAAGDFNGDMLTDLVVANTGDATVSVLLKRPDGSFAPQVTYPTGPQPIAIATGDFNGDGNLDIAVTSENCTPQKYDLQCNPSTVGILLGNGDGTFQPHMDYPVGQLPSSLLVADFNGDGKLDLAVANAFDSTVSILLGKGDGTFQPQVVYSTARSGLWGSVVAGDFNGDGKLDLAVSCASVVSVLLGNGDGSFRAHLDSGVGGASLAVGDFNRDGKLDLAVSGAGLMFGGIGGGALGILIGTGDGTFILTQQYSTGVTVTTTDLRGIGMVDLVITAYASSSVSVGILLGNGNGTFQPEVNYGTGGGPVGAVATDLNGDEKPDLAIVNSSGTVSVLLGFGDGTFVGKADYATGAGPLAVTSADFNKDGNLDLATTNQTANSVSVLLGNGDGTFQPQVSHAVGQLPVSIAAADFRNNGDIDLVIANESCPNTRPCNPGTVSVLLGNGNGTFQTHADYGVDLIPYGVAVGDFRGNGKLDLVATNNESSSVSVLLGNGDGTFQPQVGYLTASFPEQITTGDFNQDGKLDLAVSASSGVSVLLGNGDGTFAGHTEYPGGSYAITTADFNGDGKLDLAVGGEGVVSILLGNGDGTFKAPVNYSTNVVGAVFALAVTDFDQDGKLDLAVNCESAASAILLGNGDGSFQQPIQYLLANFISESLTVGDFNQDGAPDWAAGDSDGNTIGVMLSAAFKAISPGSLSFGSQGVGTTSRAQTITLSNPSNVKIKVNNIAATGQFSQTNDCPTEFSLGANCTVTVTFSPNTTGAKSGSITLTDNTRISPLAIPLTGTGVNGSFLTPYPSRVPFSAEPVGTSSPSKVVTLVNTGNAALNISAINVTGPDSSDFEETNNCPSALSTGASCTVSVTFTASAGATRTANLAITDSGLGSPQLVSLVGTGLAPSASISPNQLTFASQTVGTTSTAQTLSLTNNGNALLSITQISASGDFAETNTCNTPIAAGANCQIAITFTPTTTGNLSGTVTISDNTSGSPQTISVSGVGAAAPDFSISPASGSSTSRTISAGQTASFSLAFSPTGSFTGTIKLSCTVTPAPTPAPACSLSSPSVQISGSVIQTVTVAVGTTGPATAGRFFHTSFPPPAPPIAWMFMLLGSVGLVVINRKRWATLIAPAMLLVLLSMSCGGSTPSTHTTPGTPAGTYTVTITATSGALSHTMPLQVIVQ